MDYLTRIARLLTELGGYYVFAEGGEEYVVVPKKDFDSRGGARSDVQLSLADSAENGKHADELEAMRFNRDVADAQIENGNSLTGDGEGSIEDEIDQLEPADQVWVAGAVSEDSFGKRVRFEPLRGDLPPELQE